MLFPEDNLVNISDKDYKRLIVDYKNGSERFRFKSKTDYSKQFAHIYASRLREMRQLMTDRVKEEWGKFIKWI